MAGTRTNLAVTRDGETYNKLQRPENYLDESASASKANERKRERDSLLEPSFGSKRAKIHHPEPTVSSRAASDGNHQYRSNAPIAECGMRFTLPIEDDEAHDSDDSAGEALAYLRSVRSEASTIPNLLIASTTRTDDAKPLIARSPDMPSTKTAVSQRTFYQDGAWISVDEHYEGDYDESNENKDTHSQEHYYHGLIKRFQNFRRALGLEIHKLAKSDPGTDQPSSLQPPSNRHDWLYAIDREFPVTARICQLDDYSVRRGLEYCAHALDRFDTISRQKSCWIWTLLALSGDVGTLDSQKMSHIRDLAAKAAEMSNVLHEGSQQHKGGHKTASLLEELADEAQDIGNEVGEPAHCIANTDAYIAGTGYVRSDSNEDVNATAVGLSSHARPRTQDDAQRRTDQAAEIHEKANTVMNDNALEEARARLLAQLGDNLIHAGIPAQALVTDKRHPGHSVQPGQDSDPTQNETKVRAIPSRAEAERQRQVMRMRQSATVGSGQSESTRSDLSTLTTPATDDKASYAVDLNTRVTLDMILTVVGECYGQRDLLRSRKSW